MLQGYKRALRTNGWHKVSSIIRWHSRCCSPQNVFASTATFRSSRALQRPICCPNGKSELISINYFRRFSTSSLPSRQDNANNDKGGSVVFYRRNPAENRIPRGNIAFCCFHTAYWSWYAERCIEAFLLENWTSNVFFHPNAGVYGFTFAMVLNFACYHYSTLIVSKMAFHRQTGKVKIWFHKLPFLKEADTPVEFDLGEVFLDRSKAEVVYLLEKLGGDMSEFRGHLPLMVESDHFRSRFPLLLYCNDGYVVKDNNMFLEALLFDKLTEEGEEWQQEVEGSSPEAFSTNTKTSRRLRSRSGRRAIQRSSTKPGRQR